MTDTSHTAGGRQPTNRIAANTYNPTVGATTQHPLVFPIGTPVVQSIAHEGTVIPGRANDASTSFVTGLAAGAAVAGSSAIVQMAGPITLTTAEWDAITGDSGGIVRGVPYYLSAGSNEGRLTRTPPSDDGEFVVQVGIGMSANDLLIQICCPQPAG